MSASPLTSALDRWLAEHGDELVAVRRQLHAHPEPSGEEYAATELVADRLEVAGLAPRVLSTGTGLVCDVPVGSGGDPVVALRADLDALRMDDDKEVHYRSRRPGVAHACGHDAHTAIVLGAGLFLAHHPPLVDAHRGTVRLLFQPAEESLPGGALDVIAEGGLDGVGAVFGLHCEPKMDVGTVGVRTGPITSASDRLELSLCGPGGHTARPEETVDLVSVAAHLVGRLPGMVRERVGDHAAVRVVFGAVHAGDAANVIPAHAHLRASVRTPSPAVWDRLPATVTDAVRSIAAEHGAECDITYTSGVPPVINDQWATEVLFRAAASLLGERSVVEAPQSWGGDDFAWYLRHVPGSYLRLGTHDPASSGPRLDLHAGHFDIDERAIALGVRVLVGAGLDALAALMAGPTARLHSC